jgi:hypothetical protein
VLVPQAVKYVAVMPYVLEDFKAKCLAGCKLDPLLLVDNTTNNLGIMRSHNLGVDLMREHDADWLVILSAAVRFGAEGGLDFISALDRREGHAVVNAEGLYGWHLMAFARDTIEAAGKWDENFFPYGFDDNDLAIRIHKAQPAAIWSGVRVDVSDTIMGHSLKLGGVRAPAPPLLLYFRQKWGDIPGPPFDAYHDTPWNDPTLPVGYWPEHNGGEWDRPAPPTAQATIR